MRAIIILALLGAVMAIPKRLPERIVGGVSTAVENYPFMANMQYNLWGITWMQWCGGSLINNRAILSAAHCFDGDRASDWRVVLGTSFVSSGGTEYGVQAIRNHPRYSGQTLNNDVSILLLTTAVTFTNSIRAGRIPSPTYILPDNTRVTTIGWGALWSGGPSPSDLQEVDIYTISQRICAERYAHLKTLPGFANWPDITDEMLCAGIMDVGGKDACQGDSGGPLIHDNDVVVGVVSWGYGCADATYPGVNARTSSFTDWIVDNA